MRIQIPQTTQSQHQFLGPVKHAQLADGFQRGEHKAWDNAGRTAVLKAITVCCNYCGRLLPVYNISPNSWECVLGLTGGGIPLCVGEDIGCCQENLKRHTESLSTWILSLPSALCNMHFLGTCERKARFPLISAPHQGIFSNLLVAPRSHPHRIPQQPYAHVLCKDAAAGHQTPESLGLLCSRASPQPSFPSLLAPRPCDHSLSAPWCQHSLGMRCAFACQASLLRNTELS